MAPRPKPEREPREPKRLARRTALKRGPGPKRTAGPARSKPIAPRSKNKPPRVGTRSTVNPHDTFRVRVWEASGRRCVVTGTPSPHPDTCRGQFDPAHLIPAERIRAERLEDWVYATAMAVWCRRAEHFAHDHGARDVIRRHHIPPAAWEAAATMDRIVSERDGRERQPFTAYLEGYKP